MKERILETADRLFYLQGIRAIGVDTIAAEIGISKRTLYNHFPSKDALISAYLARRFVRRAIRQTAGRADSRHLRFAGATFCGQGFSRLPLRQCGRRTRRRTARSGRIAIAFKESRRLWFRDLLVQLGVTDAEGACDAAGAAGRRLDRAGPGARRPVDGARGKGSGTGAAEECGD